MSEIEEAKARRSPVDKTLRKEWEKFLNGHWQREMPQKEGQYRLATLEGFEAHTEVVYLSPRTGGYCSVCPWDAWWWSEPFPKFPPVPKP